MSYSKKLEFANFTCKFGESLKLLDLFQEIVFPALKEGNFSRTLRGTDYFFINTHLLTVRNYTNNAEDLVLAGRLVKNTKLKREQIFRQGQGIIEDIDELESAPTAIFVLTLNNHRLLYMKEVAGAPDMKTFQSTCQKFLRDRHRVFIDDLYETSKFEREHNSDIEILTKKKLIEKYPFPELRITTLTDSTSLRNFVNQFKKIEEFTIKLLPTNNEDIDNDGFWAQLGDSKDRMGSKYATTKFGNKKDGLDQEEVYEQSNLATELANSSIKMKGTDHSGGALKGNNEDFQLTVNIDEISRQVGPATAQLYAEFLNQIQAGNITVPKETHNIIQKINALKQILP